ncbi:MAG: hypothetical protein ACI9KE_006594, partial [Polyangiales bacterium]
VAWMSGETTLGSAGLELSFPMITRVGRAHAVSRPKVVCNQTSVALLARGYLYEST